MKAAIFDGTSRLVVKDIPIPEPRSFEALIKVAACGLCHTDLHYLDHGVPTFQKPPIVMGHEISGTVMSVGKHVEGWKAGDRVVVPSVLTCGRCSMCRRGRENICERMAMLGNHRDGGLAEFIAVPVKDLASIPDSLPLDQACLIADAVSTGFHAVAHRGNVRAGDTVAVFGCGGVGMNIVQAAALLGAQVYAVDIDGRKLEIAMGLGAVSAVNASRTPDVAKHLKELTSGGVDVALEAIGNPATQRQAFESVRRGGRLVLVGYANKLFELPAGKTMFFEMEIVGSLGCRPVDYPRIISLAAEGKIRLAPLITSRHALSEVNEAYDHVRRSDGLRAVIVM